MPKDKEKKISVKVKANLKKRDPDTGELIEEEETEEIISGKNAIEFLRKKGVNVDGLDK